MAEAFKNWLNKDVISLMASHFAKHYANFNQHGFIDDATDNLDSLELKARTKQITQAMIQHLPDDFETAGDILLASLGKPLGDSVSDSTTDEQGIAGWAIMSLTYYVALQGQEHFDYSMTLLKAMTKRATAEFDIRFFLISAPTKTLATLNSWINDNDHHIRRLVSEGTRPRLPWGMQLRQFIDDPSPIIKLLEQLKDDPSEYVRRSVANSLNDISKDHPDLVADITEQWLLNASKDRQRLLRHACRTLLKAGHTKTLSLFGFKPVALKSASLIVSKKEVILGESLEFELELHSESKTAQSLMVDYIIHHQKANGKISAKVFKLRTMTLLANKPLQLVKKHAIKPISTRKYYPGLHSLEIMINGQSVAKVDFKLHIPH